MVAVVSLEQHIVESLERIENKVDELAKDVNTPPRPGLPGGLLSRMEKQELAAAEAKALIELLRKDVEELKLAPGERAVKFSDWLKLTIVGLALAGLSTLIGLYLSVRH